jgi:hypothetical protein
VQSRHLNGLLIVASLVSFTVPFCAQGQHQNVAKLKADARNVVGIIGADKDKTPFVVVLRGLGTARTGAYFSTAPFIGSAAAVVLLGEPITAQLLLAAALMALGVWLHLTERHEHEHFHEGLVHTHPHVHDIHHRHAHKAGDPPGEPHTHAHQHSPMRHTHPHVPDMHHTHRHS